LHSTRSRKHNHTRLCGQYTQLIAAARARSGCLLRDSPLTTFPSKRFKTRQPRGLILSGGPAPSTTIPRRSLNPVCLRAPLSGVGYLLRPATNCSRSGGEVPAIHKQGVRLCAASRWWIDEPVIPGMPVEMDCMDESRRFMSPCCLMGFA